MWPWEHAAIGYILYSIGLRLIGRDPPSGREAGALLAASILPDLIDKPLSWSLQLTPSGYGFLHSVFVAVPAGLAITIAAFRSERRRLGVAVVVGYWSHLVADVLAPIRAGEEPLIGRVLWPIVDTAPYAERFGIGRGLVYLREFLESLLTMSPFELVVFYLALPAITIGLWMVDGLPGASVPRRILAAISHHFL